MLVLETGAGYRDNIALSHAAPEASPFIRVACELMVYNLHEDKPQLTLYLFGDHLQFLSSPSVDTEDVAFAQAQVKRAIHDHGEASLGVEYVFQNQVLDLSVTDTFRQSVLALGHTITGRPEIRLNLLGRTWLTLEMPFARQYFDEPLDDYWETGPRMELGWDYGRKSTLSLSYEATERVTDTLTALGADGASIPGTTRRLLQHDARVTWRHRWDAEGLWQTKARFGCLVQRDNGGGYLDYNSVVGSADVRYHTQAWEVEAGATAGYGLFPVQPASPIDPSQRNRTSLRLMLTAERKLTRHVRLTAAYEREQVWSNQTLDTYTVNTATGGLACEF
jgi:hypothetical protein